MTETPESEAVQTAKPTHITNRQNSICPKKRMEKANFNYTTMTNMHKAFRDAAKL